MSFNRPTLTDLVSRARADLDARLPGADSRLRASVLDVLVTTHAGGMNGLYGYLDWLSRQILPDTADGAQLARWASIWGVSRKTAVAASGGVRATGVNATIVLAGAVLVRLDGARFVVKTAAQVAAGVVDLAVEAEASGADSNCAVGQQLQFASPVPGIDAVVTVAAGGIIGGAQEESDAALLERLLLRIRNPPHGGSKADYQRWALEVAGVSRAWVYPGWLGSGSVGVAFMMDGRPNPVPLAGDVAAVQAYLDPLRPVTAALTVYAPVPRALNLVVQAFPPSDAVRAAIIASVADTLSREAEPGGRILVSHIREAISLAPGEYDHVLVAPINDQVAGPGEIFVMGAVNWA